jgi:DNA-binding NarL/FixJ family response regulator
VVGEAATAADAIRCDGELKPDVVVLDIGLPGVSGIEILRRIIARRIWWSKRCDASRQASAT